MRILSLVCLLFLLVFRGALSASEPFADVLPLRPGGTTGLIACRGDTGPAPDNTARAIEYAIQDGLELIAVDVRLTRDGQHVLAAEERLEQFSDGNGAVAESTWEDIVKLDVGGRFAKRFAGTPPLLLAQALELAKGRIGLYLRLHRADPKTLLPAIQAAGGAEQVLITGCDRLLEEVQSAWQTKLPTVWDWNPENGTTDWLAQKKPVAVRVAAAHLTTELVSTFHNQRIGVVAACGDAPLTDAARRALIAAGADLIESPTPEELFPGIVRAKKPDWPVKIAIHRGASRYAPENTLPAFAKAVWVGADYVEFDVRTTRDGVCLLLHDGTLNRTTSGKGPIANATAGEVALLDAGSWFARRFQATPVPSLATFLDSMAAEPCGLYFDAKSLDPQVLADELRKRGLLERTVVYQGADYLRRLKRLEPRIRAMPPLGGVGELASLEDLRPFAVDVRWGNLSADLIQQCHARGIQVFSDAIGRHERIEGYQQAIGWGIDTIQTDHPLRVVRAIEKLQK